MVEQKPRRGQAASPPDALDFGILLGLAYQSFVERMREDLRAQGFDDLGGAYGYVFRALAHEELSQRELAGRLDITDQGMAKIVAEMVERGYVERRPDPDDSRVKRLRLGARGKAALRAARGFHAAFERDLGRTLGANRVRELRAQLEGIAGRDDRSGAHARLRPT